MTDSVSGVPQDDDVNAAGASDADAVDAPDTATSPSTGSDPEPTSGSASAADTGAAATGAAATGAAATGAAATGPSAAASTSAPAAAASSSPAVLWVVIAVLGAALAGIGAFLLFNSNSSDTPKPSPTAPATAPVPDVVGLNEADATNALVAGGFVVGQVVTEPDPTVAAGTVLAQSPEAGRNVATGTKVTLRVSVDDSILVPSLEGMTLTQATNTLLANNLQLGAVTKTDSAKPADTVLQQDPKPGARTNSDAPVNVVVSNGKQSVPDVRGKDEAAARAQIADAGYVVDIVRQDTTKQAEDGVVLKQNPSAGKNLEVGKTVVLTIGKYVAPTPTPTPSPSVSADDSAN